MTNSEDNPPVLTKEQELTIEEERKLLAFSMTELENLANKVSKAIERKKEKERNDLITMIIDMATQANIGVDFYDLESRKRELPAKYRNPDNPCQCG